VPRGFPPEYAQTDPAASDFHATRVSLTHGVLILGIPTLTATVPRNAKRGASPRTPTNSR